MRTRIIILCTAISAASFAVIMAPRRSRTISASPAPAHAARHTDDNSLAATRPVGPEALHADQHASPVLPTASTDEAVMGFLHAALTSDREQVAVHGALLLKPGSEMPPAMSRFLNCGTVDVEVETMRFLIQTRRAQALAMVLGRMLILDLTSPDAGRYTDVFAESRDYAVAKWLADCLASGNAKLSMQAALLLSILNGPETAIVLSIQSSPGNVEPTRLLAERNDVTEVDALIAIYTDTDHADLREAVAFSLAQIGSPQACRFLIEESLDYGRKADSALAAISTITSSYSQTTLLDAAVDRALPEPTRIAAVTALFSQKSEHVAMQLSNLNVEPTQTELADAIDLALESYENERRTHSLNSTFGASYEICF